MEATRWFVRSALLGFVVLAGCTMHATPADRIHDGLDMGCSTDLAEPCPTPRMAKNVPQFIDFLPLFLYVGKVRQNCVKWHV